MAILPHNLAQRWGLLGDRFLGEDVRYFPLFVSEVHRRSEVRMRSTQADQSRQAPRDEHIGGQAQFNFSGATELQGFDPTTVFEHMEEGLDFPAAAIPFDKSNEIAKDLRVSVCQQGCV